MVRLLPENVSSQRFGFFAGCAVFALLLLAPTPEGMTPEAQRTAAAAALMSLWWIFEASDIAVTALVPVALFPLLGIMSAEATAAHYATHIVFLYLGGFIIALGVLAMEAIMPAMVLLLIIAFM